MEDKGKKTKAKKKGIASWVWLGVIGLVFVYVLGVWRSDALSHQAFSFLGWGYYVGGYLAWKEAKGEL